MDYQVVWPLVALNDIEIMKPENFTCFHLALKKCYLGNVRAIFVSVFLTLALLPAVSVYAEPTLNSVLRAVPIPADGTVKLDGGLSEWDRSGQIVMADDIERPSRLVRVSAMYDSTGLYIAFEFKDSTPMINHVDPQSTPGKGWCGDAVQLRIDSDYESNFYAPPLHPMQIIHVDGYWHTDTKKSAAYVVYGDLGPDGSIEKTITQAIGHGVDIAFKADADGQGYVQEMRLTWALLRPNNPQPFKPGQSLRMGIETMWGDIRSKHDPADRITDLLNPQNPDRDSLWTNRSAWGRIEFCAQGKFAPSETAKLWPLLLERYEPQRKLEVEQSSVPALKRPCRNNSKEIWKLLNQWFTEGTAAGNIGDYYDNRDRGHSSLDSSQYPQISKVEYSAEQLDKRIDYGLCLEVRPNVTIGNSSTASPPDRGGSNPRYAQVNSELLARLYAQYRGGNLHIYPAHLDYAHPGGSYPWSALDLYPLNTPYTLISHGSSGTDRPFMDACFHTLAAFDPKLKSKLLESGFLMPAIQAILRASNTQVLEPEDYFTGKAHPAVFKGDQLDALKMARAAHEMRTETVPPLAQVRILEEDTLRPGVDISEGSPSEKLCDSPGVIGRIHRRWTRDMRMRVSAAESIDIEGKPLIFRWVLLQGDPKLVRIEPDSDGRQATLTLAWHDRIPVQPTGKPLSNRVDIGVFAGNGKAWSVPAFICVYYPDNELRTYDDDKRLVELFSAAGDTNIGFENSCLVPADKSSLYQIRDWAALMKLACGDGGSLPAKLFRSAFNDAQRAHIAEVIQIFNERIAVIKAKGQPTAPPPAQNQSGTAQPSDSPRPPNRRDAEWISQPLIVSNVKDQIPVKTLLENALNAWKNDPLFYLKNRNAVDEAAVKLGDKAVQNLASARQRLIGLGIYKPTANGGWELQSIRAGNAPVTQRLTRYEILELQRFHLALLNQILLPGVLAHPYTPNHVDPRITQPQPYWDTFSYEAGPRVQPTLKRRQTDPLIKPKPLEDP
jgi:hypothetical protein